MKKTATGRAVRGILAVSTLMAAVAAGAQTQTSLPAPSRTAFKCVVAGKVSYSDSPCPDAQRIELQPTRGLDKSSGRTMTGNDVRDERTRDQIAEAVKPLTGLTPAQFEVQRRRVYLSGAAKAECSSLDRNLLAMEQAASATPRSAQAERSAHELLVARQRYRTLGC